ncbi:MAG: hypothetical protein DRI48_06670, partial [Chloroflexi bacterium]
MITNSNSGGKRESSGNARWWAWLRLILLGTVLSGVTGAVIVLPLLPVERVVLEEGEVAPRDIRAPRSVTYESGILYAEAQERAAARVEPIYTPPDPAIARQQLDRARKVLNYLGAVRADTLASAAQKRAWILAVPELVDASSGTIEKLLALSDESWNRVHAEILSVIDQAMRREIREEHLGEAMEGIPALVSLDLSDEETAVTVALVRHFLVPNSSLDAEATSRARVAAQEEEPPVLRTFEAQEIIVREGERVSALDIEALDQLGLRQSQTNWTDVIEAALLSILATLVLYLYLGRFQPDVLWDGQKSFILMLLTSLSVLAAGFTAPGDGVLRYLAPAPTLAMLTAATLGPHAGVASAVFLGTAVGAISDYSLEMTVYATFGGIIAALTLGRVERIGSLFRAGAFAALTHAVVIAIFNLSPRLADPGNLLLVALSGVLNGGISASLALGGLFLMGPLFDITTTMRLIELSRPDRPLLQRLLREAPATYHHSLMVANLAEQAAERIGADALLTRVGA